MGTESQLHRMKLESAIFFPEEEGIIPQGVAGGARFSATASQCCGLCTDTGKEPSVFSNFSPGKKKKNPSAWGSPNLFKRFNAYNASYFIPGILLHKKNDIPFLKSLWCANGVLVMDSNKYMTVVCKKGEKGGGKKHKNPTKNNGIMALFSFCQASSRPRFKAI